MEQKFPSHICQVGQIEFEKKVLIEDYALSFLTQLLKDHQDFPRLLVFFGDGYIKNNVQYFYIKGIAERNKELGKNDFEKSDKKFFARTGKKYFPESKPIGWYILDGQAGGVMDVICGMKEQDFSELEGYYIYYDSNRHMEEYMLQYESGQMIKPVKARLIQNEKGAGISIIAKILHEISLLVMIICCTIAVIILNGYDKIKELEETVVRVERQFELQKNLPVN